MAQITSGSFSRLKTFDECELRAKFKYVDRIPEPDRGPPPRGKQEWPNDRGSRLHDEAEEFVRGKRDLSPELQHFSTELFQARELFSQGRATTEQMWCYGKNWKPIKETDRKNTRFRIKADLTVSLSPTHAVVTDYKTGKRYGNEVSHEKQKQVYAIGMFLRNPKLQKVTTELWYFDLPDEDIHASVLTRAQALFLLKGLDARLQRMFDTVVFTPKPSKYNCRWCPYRGNVCPHGVTS